LWMLRTVAKIRKASVITVRAIAAAIIHPPELMRGAYPLVRR
jgi:hypothetical protein